MRRTRQASAFVLASVLLGTAPSGFAATVAVPCSAAALITAINDANAAGGANTLALAEGCVYSFAAVNNYWYGPNALPPITSNLTVLGHGATLERDGMAPPFRLFYVSGGFHLASGQLTMRELTIRGGYAKGGDSDFGGAGAGMGGAIFNQGVLVLDRVALHDNLARGGNGGANAYAGGGIGQDASAYTSGGFGPGFVAPPNAGGLGGAGGVSSGGGGGGFIAGANGVNGNNGVNGKGAPGGGWGDLGYNGADGGAGGNVSSGGAGAGGGGVGGGGGAGAGAAIGAGGDFGAGGQTGTGTGGSGGFGGGGGWAGGGFGTTGGRGGFGGGGGASIGGVRGDGGFGAGHGSPNTGRGGGGGGFGGAIFNHEGSLLATNVTLSGNSARGGVVDVQSSGTPSQPGSGLGGAIFNLNGSVQLTYATVAFNSVVGSNGNAVGRGPGNGAAIYSLAYGNAIIDGSASGAELALTDSIVFNNTGASHAVANHVVHGAQLNSAVLTHVGANLVESYGNLGDAISGGTMPLSDDPLLGALAANGGGTMTHALAATSPAVGAATACAGQPVTDQRGYGRVDGAPDLGAFERDGSPGWIHGDSFESGPPACP